MTGKPTKDGDQPEGRGDDGRFAPGNPFGREGRKTGSRNKASLLLDRLADDEAQELFKATLAAAKAGEEWAMALILNRIWPARKSRAVEIELPSLQGVQDALIAQSAIVDAAASGHLTVDEAQALTSVVDAYRRAVETVTIEERLRKLEEAMGHK